jgi:Ca2+-binding EF-hand superfamily protein
MSLAAFPRRIALVALLSLSACGVPSGLSPATPGNVPVQALAAQTLKEGFKRVHKAIFARLDANHDNFIDEYEAGPNLPLDIFEELDRDHDGKISYTRFMEFATEGGLLAPDDTADRFFGRMRNFLADVFKRLDRPSGGWFSKGDGYLTPEELGATSVAKLGLGFKYPSLNLRVLIPAFDEAALKAADRTGDGRISQGEFEDLYIEAVIQNIASAAL